MQHNQIVVAADDECRASRQSEFQISVVFWVTAVGDAFGRDESHRHATYRIQNMLATLDRQDAGEFRAAEHLGDFVIDLC